MSGVLIATDDRIADARRRRLAAVRAASALVVDEAVAERYGDVLAVARSQRRGAKATDLLIIATAAAPSGSSTRWMRRSPTCRWQPACRRRSWLPELGKDPSDPRDASGEPGHRSQLLELVRRGVAARARPAAAPAMRRAPSRWPGSSSSRRTAAAIARPPAPGRSRSPAPRAVDARGVVELVAAHRQHELGHARGERLHDGAVARRA